VPLGSRLLRLLVLELGLVLTDFEEVLSTLQEGVTLTNGVARTDPELPASERDLGDENTP
jgi:hypothetical protein